MRAALNDKENPDLASNLRLRMAEVAEPRQLSALLLADLGDQLRLVKRPDDAIRHYRTILTWYPRSLLKDRAYAGLGLIALTQGESKQALDYFALFEKESFQSPLLAQVLRAKADLYLAQGKKDEAIRELERILEVKSAKGRPWVEALYQIGEIRMGQKDPKRAIPYFQRIYVLYARWSDMVAKAYWQSGQAFEQLGMTQEALNTYKEFTGQPHLQETAEFSKALDRLKKRGTHESLPDHSFPADAAPAHPAGRPGGPEQRSGHAGRDPRHGR
ncbi:MAG: tetratricopeptide repeat protein [Blastochloris sp.]|nr:tetratricopeptide repeat protein [Blastochloris sp.]